MTDESVTGEVTPGESMTCTVRRPAAVAAPSSPPRRLWAAAGGAAAVLSFTGVHLMHPPGAPEHMSDAEVVAWITPSATQVAAGGSLGLLACLLLLVFAQGWSAQLASWSAPAWACRLAASSVTTTAAVLGVGALLQVTAGLSALPSENPGQPSLSATLVNLYGAVAVSGWVLLLPAVLAGLASWRRTPRWSRTVCAIAGVGLTACLALPPVSWCVAAGWLLATGLGCLREGPAARGLGAPGLGRRGKVARRSRQRGTSGVPQPPKFPR